VWDAKTTDCLRFFSPSGAGRHITELTSIHTLMLSPLNPEYIVVGSKSNTVHLMNLKVDSPPRCVLVVSSSLPSSRGWCPLAI
jgi:WD40 repeat protein